MYKVVDKAKYLHNLLNIFGTFNSGLLKKKHKYIFRINI
jgi:hypothetical protein